MMQEVAVILLHMGAQMAINGTRKVTINPNGARKVTINLQNQNGIRKVPD